MRIVNIVIKIASLILNFEGDLIMIAIKQRKG